MRQKSGPKKAPAEQGVKDIRRATCRQFSAEEKIGIVLEGCAGEHCRAVPVRGDRLVDVLLASGARRLVEDGRPVDRRNRLFQVEAVAESGFRQQSNFRIWRTADG